MTADAAFLVAIGLPGSGKSTVCSHFTDASHHNAVWIRFDDVLEFLMCPKTPWPLRRRYMLDCFDTIFEYRHQMLNKDIRSSSQDQQSTLNVREIQQNKIPLKIWHEFLKYFPSSGVLNFPVVFVLDDTMHLRSMRYSYYQLCRKYGLGFCQFFVNTPLTVALERNAGRPGRARIDDKILHFMNDRLEPPDLKNRWEQNVMTCDSSGKTFDLQAFSGHLDRLVSDALDHPADPTPLEDPKLVAEKERDREINARNWAHRVDSCVRKVVGELVNYRREREAGADDARNRSFDQGHNRSFDERKRAYNDRSFEAPNSHHPPISSDRFSIDSDHNDRRRSYAAAPRKSGETAASVQYAQKLRDRKSRVVKHFLQNFPDEGTIEYRNIFEVLKHLMQNDVPS